MNGRHDMCLFAVRTPHLRTEHIPFGENRFVFAVMYSLFFICDNNKNETI